MTTEIRSQLNVRLSQDANISVSVSTFVATPEDAHTAGLENARMVTAYLSGYNEASEEAAAE